jgi:hypothetical protein
MVRRWILERLPKVFFVSCWLRHRPAASDCIDNPSGLPASSSLQPSSSLRLKTKELSAITLVTAGLMLAVGGCVERELTITSEPAGALVYIGDREVGRTPITTPFTWYGDYDIILRREGYQTLSTHADINMPAYEVPPLDLLSEIAPWHYKDNRYLHFTMEKYTPPDEQELIDRARKMQQRTAQTTQPATQPAGE